VPQAPIDLDAETLRRCLRLGGLAVDRDRAAAVLPLARALLAGCGRLAALDLAVPGGSGIAGDAVDRQ
jgi:hypothetical protein